MRTISCTGSSIASVHGIKVVPEQKIIFMDELHNRIYKTERQKKRNKT